MAAAKEDAAPTPIDNELTDSAYQHGVFVGEYTGRPNSGRFVPQRRAPVGEATPAAQSVNARDVLMRVTPNGGGTTYKRISSNQSSYAWLR